MNTATRFAAGIAPNTRPPRLSKDPNAGTFVISIEGNARHDQVSVMERNNTAFLAAVANVAFLITVDVTPHCTKHNSTTAPRRFAALPGSAGIPPASSERAKNRFCHSHNL